MHTKYKGEVLRHKEWFYQILYCYNIKKWYNVNTFLQDHYQKGSGVLLTVDYVDGKMYMNLTILTGKGIKDPLQQIIQDQNMITHQEMVIVPNLICGHDNFNLFGWLSFSIVNAQPCYTWLMVWWIPVRFSALSENFFSRILRGGPLEGVRTCEYDLV